jgi:hypothetical protein
MCIYRKLLLGWIIVAYAAACGSPAPDTLELPFVGIGDSQIADGKRSDDLLQDLVVETTATGDVADALDVIGVEIIDSVLCLDDAACDDGDPCTVDTCSPDEGCGHTPKCGDGTVCLSGEKCCKPLVCGQLGAACGLVGDLCGGSLDCGDCPDGEDCVDNVCSDGVCGFEVISEVHADSPTARWLDESHIVVAVAHLGLELFEIADGTPVNIQMLAIAGLDGHLSLSVVENEVLVASSSGPNQVHIVTFEGGLLQPALSFAVPEEYLPISEEVVVPIELLSSKMLIAYTSTKSLSSGWDKIPAEASVVLLDISALPIISVAAVWQDRAVQSIGVRSDQLFATWVEPGADVDEVVQIDLSVEPPGVVASWPLPSQEASLAVDDFLVVAMESPYGFLYRPWDGPAEAEWIPSYLPFGSVTSTSWGDHVVFSHTTGGVAILDLSPSPVLIGQIEMPYVNYVLEDGGQQGLLLRVGDNGIFFIPPGAKTWKDGQALRIYNGRAREVGLDQSTMTVWYTTKSSIVGLDVSVPEEPKIVGTIFPGGTPNDLRVGPGVLFVLDAVPGGDDANRGYDVSDPSAPVSIPLDPTCNSNGHGVDGDLYVAMKHEQGLDVELLTYARSKTGEWAVSGGKPLPSCSPLQLAVRGNTVAVECGYGYTFFQAEEDGTVVETGMWTLPQSDPDNVFGYWPSILMAGIGAQRIAVARIEALVVLEVSDAGLPSVVGTAEISHWYVPGVDAGLGGFGNLLLVPGCVQAGSHEDLCLFDMDSPDGLEFLAATDVPALVVAADLGPGLAIATTDSGKGTLRLMDVSGCW